MEQIFFCFVITPDGSEKAVMFHTENFMPMIGNFFLKTKNSKVKYFVKMNENSQVLALDFATYTEQILQKKELRLTAQKNISIFFSQQNNFQNNHLGLSAEDFLQWLMKNYAFIFQRFSAKDIANFMGVSPTWLSLLKRKML